MCSCMTSTHMTKLSALRDFLNQVRERISGIDPEQRTALVERLAEEVPAASRAAYLEMQDSPIRKIAAGTDDTADASDVLNDRTEQRKVGLLRILHEG